MAKLIGFTRLTVQSRDAEQVIENEIFWQVQRVSESLVRGSFLSIGLSIHGQG
jgi:hypothetical protein